MLNNKSILVTGGTGTFGKAFVNYVLKNYPDVKRLVVYSRDEQKQFLMDQEFPQNEYPALRYFVGDVRDFDRLKRALSEIDYVVHAAAMKHVHIAEYNPDECVKTNINGAENVINACLETDVKKVVALSTDKACSPINLYGATKLTSDKLFIAANNLTGKKSLTFSVVRYGNVFGSNGSVAPFFLKKRKEGVLPITSPDMTRFNITIEEGIKMVLHTFEHSWGGELLVPKIPSFKVTDLAEAIAPECEQKIIGLRPGEKIHEEMISRSDSYYTYDLGEYYSIIPNKRKWKLSDYIDHFEAKEVKNGFKYSSGNNEEWETVESLREMVKKHVDPEFELVSD